MLSWGARHAGTDIAGSARADCPRCGERKFDARGGVAFRGRPIDGDQADGTAAGDGQCCPGTLWRLPPASVGAARRCAAVYRRGQAGHHAGGDPGRAGPPLRRVGVPDDHSRDPAPARPAVQKKILRAAEQDRPDVARRRRRWRAWQRYMDPARFVFLDETGATTKMTRLYGRAPRGERLIGSVPHGHCKTSTLVAWLRQSGIIAPLVLDGPM